MSKVNRATYQRVVEENKKLMADIRLLVSRDSLSPERILCAAKWSKVFDQEKEFSALMKAAATRYILDNADELPEFLTNAVKREQET